MGQSRKANTFKRTQRARPADANTKTPYFKACVVDQITPPSRLGFMDIPPGVLNHSALLISITSWRSLQSANRSVVQRSACSSTRSCSSPTVAPTFPAQMTIGIPPLPPSSRFSTHLRITKCAPRHSLSVLADIEATQHGRPPCTPKSSQLARLLTGKAVNSFVSTGSQFSISISFVPILSVALITGLAPASATIALNFSHGRRTQIGWEAMCPSLSALTSSLHSWPRLGKAMPHG